MAWTFGEYELDPHRYRLLRGAEQVRLEPKAFDLLVYLIQRRDRVVGKEELLERLWPGQFVSDTALTFSIRAIRRTFGDDRKGQSVIRTVYGRGYQFVAACEEKPDAEVEDAGVPTEGGDLAPLFVGRQEEMQRLCAAYGSTAAGKGGVWILGGEAGIGKSRAAKEFAAWCRQQGAEVLVGRCYEASETPPYWPWAEMLRSYIDAHSAAELRAVTGAGANDLAQVAPALRDKLQLGESRPADNSPNARLRLFDSIAGFISKVAALQPLVLLLDDLHTADDASLLLLEMIGASLHDTRCLIVATCRDGDLDAEHPLRHATNTLRRARCLEEITLRALGEADVTAWLDAIGGHGFALDLAHRIYAHTEGNPFFIEQTLHHLIEEGTVQRENGGWRCDLLPADLGVPAGVRDVLLERMQRLSMRCVEALRMAAVAGRDFEAAVVAQAMGVPAHDFDEAMDEAERAGFVHALSDAGDRYAFVHSLVRQTQYEQIRPARRRAVHRQLAKAIEQSGDDELDTRMTALAHHAYLGAQTPESVEKAIATERRAAEHAGSRLAFEEALHHYQRALTLLERKDSADQKLRCELMLAQGHAALRATQGSQARLYFQRAADLAREIGDTTSFAQAALGVGLVYENMPLQDNEATLELLQEALRVAGSTDTTLRVQLLCQLSITAHFTSTPEYREQLSREALEIARRLGDTTSLLAALKIRYNAACGTPDAETRLAISSEAIALAGDAGDAGASLYPHLWRKTELLILGDTDAAEVEMGILAQLAQETRDPFMLWATTGDPYTSALLAGRFEECEGVIRKALSAGQKIAEVHAVQLYYVQLIILRLAQGRLGELEDEIERLSVQHGMHPVHRCALEVIRAERAPADAPPEKIESTAPESLGRDISYTCCAALLALACAATEDRARAAALYEGLLPYEKQCVIAGFGVISMGAVAGYLGLLAGLLGRFDESARHYETALEVNVKSRSLPWLAHTQYDYGRFLLARNAEVERGRRLLADALQTAERLDMPGLVAAIREG